MLDMQIGIKWWDKACKAHDIFYGKYTRKYLKFVKKTHRILLWTLFFQVRTGV